MSILSSSRGIMKALLNFSILSRLISSYLLIIVIVLLSGIYTIWTLNDLNKTIRSITTADARMIRLSEECLEILDRENAAEEKLFVSNDAEYLRQFKDFQSDFNGRLADLESHVDRHVVETLWNLSGLTRSVWHSVRKRHRRMSSRKLADPELTDYRAERDRITAEAGRSCGNSHRPSHMPDMKK